MQPINLNTDYYFSAKTEKYIVLGCIVFVLAVSGFFLVHNNNYRYVFSNQQNQLTGIAAIKG